MKRAIRGSDPLWRQFVPAKSLTARIGRTVLLIFIAAAVISGVVVIVGVRSLLIRSVINRLQRSLDTIAPSFIQAATAEPAQYESIQQLCSQFGGQFDLRITFVLPDGTVPGESELDPDTLDNHGNRPEVIEAIEQGRGASLRFSETVQQRMIYAALALQESGRFLGVLRAATPLHKATFLLGSFWLVAGPLLLFVVIAGSAAVLLTSGILRRSFGRINGSVERFRAGEFARPLHIPEWQETRGIVELINSMGRQLNESISSASRQQTLEKAILTSMVEGVLAIDSQMRIINLNEAAARLLRISREEALNHRIEEVVRISAILEFIQRTLESSTPLEEDLLIYDERERFFRAHGTMLLDSKGESIGALVALYDNTKVHRLELIRKEFAANVSHELKTPITSIKGFAETLLDSGLDNREERMRFLSIIVQQTDRLIAIVDDLLSLARIEEDVQREGVVLNVGRLRGVIDSAVSTCAGAAKERKIGVQIECPYDITVAFNPQLLEQALVNLIDNAIKYSNTGSSISISVKKLDRQICIAVKDHGCGIAEEHIPRLFERFYRVDKARSRALGGTGLGLAIVKHIVLSHKGRVEVDSRVGEGSTFTICLPWQKDDWRQ
jgi:two-component system phosphate regulon sensor histidine kinase PhoR